MSSRQGIQKKFKAGKTVSRFKGSARVVRTNYRTNQTATSSGLNLPAKARDFCLRKGIHAEVHATINLAKKHFAMIGKPVFEVVEDHEANQFYLGIHIQAKGSPTEVFRQSKAFFGSFLDSIASDKQDYINLIYHSEQA